MESWDYTDEGYEALMNAEYVLDTSEPLDGFGFDTRPPRHGATESDTFLQSIEWALDDIRRDGRVFALRAVDTSKDTRYWTLSSAERRLQEYGLWTERVTLALDLRAWGPEDRERGATLLVSPEPVENARAALRSASRRLSRSESAVPLFLLYSEDRSPAPEPPAPAPVTFRTVDSTEPAYPRHARLSALELQRLYPGLYGAPETGRAPAPEGPRIGSRVVVAGSEDTSGAEDTRIRYRRSQSPRPPVLVVSGIPSRPLVGRSFRRYSRLLKTVDC